MEKPEQQTTRENVVRDKDRLLLSAMHKGDTLAIFRKEKLVYLGKKK